MDVGPPLSAPATATSHAAEEGDDDVSLVVMRFAIARSRARKEVLRFLAASGRAYASEISRGTGISVTNVIGALVGNEQRFSDELSLVHFGLVDEERRPSNRLRIFHITPRGRALVERNHFGPPARRP